MGDKKEKKKSQRFLEEEDKVILANWAQSNGYARTLQKLLFEGDPFAYRTNTIVK
jgi:hypothetical protein